MPLKFETETEWAPGTIALVRDNVPGKYQHGIAVRVTSGILAFADEPVWMLLTYGPVPTADGGFVRDENVVSVRPLAVIDPEDAEQVGRLLKSLEGMSFAAHACGAHTCLRAALREFANPTPPKPEEPTGLGAVVEDAAGDKWVRMPRGGWLGTDGSSAGWSLFDAVRVLSEGVTP